MEMVSQRRSLIKKQTPKMKKEKSKLKKSNIKQLYLMMLLPVLQVFIFHYVPMFGVVIAFKDYKYGLGIFDSEWVGLDNFRTLMSTADFALAVKNTVVMNICFIVFVMAFSLLLAVILYGIKSRGAVKTYQTVLITPKFISWVIAGYMVYAFLDPNYGMLNDIIVRFGGEPIQWYSDPDLWPPILIIAYLWKFVGMDMILFYSALMGIDTTLYEAAEIDGASKIKQFIHVTVPCIAPMICMLLITKCGHIFKGDFGLFYQLPRNQGVLYPTTDVLDTYIFRVLRVNSNPSLSAAAGLIQSVVGFGMVLLVNKIIKTINPDNSLF